MKLDVKNLFVAPLGASESLSVEMFNEKFSEDILAERVKGVLKLTRLEDEILAHFSGFAKILLACDRCAEDYVTEIPLKFSQEYPFRLDAPDDDKIEVSKNFQIDIGEPVRQEVLAALPVKKICNNECSGICIKCGSNLNKEGCSCKKDNPPDIIKKIKKEKNN